MNNELSAEFGGDPCHPEIAIPHRVMAENPSWASCSPPPYGGAYDPPRALIPVTETVSTGLRASPGPSMPAGVLQTLSYSVGSTSISSSSAMPIHPGSPPSRTGASQPSVANQPGNPGPSPIVSNGDPNISSNKASTISIGLSAQPSRVGTPNQQGAPIISAVSHPPLGQSDASGVIFASHSLNAVDPAAVIANTPVTSENSGPVVGGSFIGLIPTANPSPSQANIPAPNAFPSLFASIGSQPVFADPSNPSGLVVGDQTLSQGGPAATIGNAPISVGASSLVVGGISVIPIPKPNPATSPALTPLATIGTQIISVNPAIPSAVIVGDQTLNPGSQVTVGKTPISVGTAGLVVGGTSTIPIPIPNAAAYSVLTPLVTIGNQVVSVDVANPSALVISGKTLRPGSQLTVGNTPISLNTAGLVIGGTSTIAIPTPNAAAYSVPTALATVGNQIVSVDPANPSGVIIAGQSLRPGGSAITIDNTPVSLGLAGLIISTSTTIPLPPQSPAAIFAINGQTLTLHPQQPLTLASKTLSPGSPALTLSNNRIISLASLGVVIGGSTISFSFTPTSSSHNPTGQTEVYIPITLLNGRVETAFQIAGHPGAVLLGTQTLSVGGPAATVGELVSVAAGGVVLGGSVTKSWITATTAGPDGLGGAILSGLGPWSTKSGGVGTGLTGSGNNTSVSVPLNYSASAKVEAHRWALIIGTALLGISWVGNW